ncbi:hypothetical protein roselon_00875 [Roseibacterium elongatum DSM 19469]|uniref:Uncharacterized protein n=1 Tax=Roseicyclus elongatus DSM 19469 TaxID=1294273 RepID=W8SL66_9RHOB|nr:hypothetical protein [Roseibacterium elongatum]AHM03285.1 hypothetical protein roselon_00875 [Roseibacterium elongatum DSM 19469]
MPPILSRFLPAAGLSLLLILGAIGASTRPAQADGEDAAALIGGLIALYALGQALDPDHRGGVIEVDRIYDWPRHGHPPRDIRPPRRHLLVAPARCFVQGRDRNGVYRGYVRRCMRNNVRVPDLLPHNCLRRVQTERGPRMIYGGRCLARNGWLREADLRRH